MRRRWRDSTASTGWGLSRRGGTVWEWVSPFATHARGEQGNEVFRAWRYAEDHPALAGRELDAGALAGFNRQYGLGTD